MSVDLWTIQNCADCLDGRSRGISNATVLAYNEERLADALKLSQDALSGAQSAVSFLADLSSEIESEISEEEDAEDEE